jgi:hypothetical protein
MTENNIYKDFVKAQSEFKPVILNKINPYHKNKYADLGAHLEAVTKALNNNNLSLIQKTYDCDNAVCVETVLLHSSGEFISGGLLKVPVIKNDPQGHGAALTYARRFSLGSLLSLYGEEDNDGNEHILDDNKNSNKNPIQKKLDDVRNNHSKTKSKEELIAEAEKAASLGMQSLEKFWKKDLNDNSRSLLNDCLDELKKQAEEYDLLNQDIKQ